MTLASLGGFVLRTVGIYLAALLIVRLMGKRALGTLSLFDFVIMVGIGDIIVMVGVEGSVPIGRGIGVLIILGGLELLFSLLTFKSPLAMRVLEGSPTLLVQDGKPIISNLRREHVSIADLKQELRKQGVARLSDVDKALLEACGKFSVILKDDEEPMSRRETLSQFDEIALLRKDLEEIRSMLCDLLQQRGVAFPEPAALEGTATGTGETEHAGRDGRA